MADEAQVQANDQAMDNMADEGRVTDDVMAHLTTGEIVIPLNISTNERAFEQLALMFELSGMDIREFIVGHERNKINPDTGHPEFWGFSIGPISVGSSGVKVGGTTIIGEKGMKVITQPIKTAGDVISTGVKTGAKVTEDLVGGAVDTASDLVKTSGAVVKDVVTLNPKGAVEDLTNGVKNIGNDIGGSIESAAKDTVSGVKQMAKDAYTGVVKQTANIMDVLGILPKVPEVQQGETSPTTITQGDPQNQRQQAVTDVQAAAGGGASSLTPRTVAGPDNDYKLNKSAVLGL